MKNWIELSFDDWIAIYIDGKLEHSRHDIRTEQVIDLCNKYGKLNYKNIYIDEDLAEELELWDFPSSITDLPQLILDMIGD